MSPTIAAIASQQLKKDVINVVRLLALKRAVIFSSNKLGWREEGEPDAEKGIQTTKTALYDVCSQQFR